MIAQRGLDVLLEGQGFPGGGAVSTDEEARSQLVRVPG
jgi:hypothetical protein